jgi:hypothetical protein
MNPKENMDISGNDIACGGNQFCKVCGGLDAVKNGCNGDNRCVEYNSVVQQQSTAVTRTARQWGKGM